MLADLDFLEVEDPIESSSDSIPLRGTRNEEDDESPIRTDSKVDKIFQPKSLSSEFREAVSAERSFDSGEGHFSKTRDFGESFSTSLTGRFGNRVSFNRHDKVNSVDVSGDLSEDEFGSSKTVDPRSLLKKRSSTNLDQSGVQLKRPSDFDCGNSERSCYQPHVKSDEDIASDICNTFWRPGLTFSQYKHGARLVSFEDLWPHQESLRTLLNAAYQATSLRRSVLDITKIALRCAPLSLIQELLQSRVVGLDQVFENGSTMLHLACIARNAEVVTFLCSAGINYKAQDKYGRTAEQVCYDARIRRLLPLNAQRNAAYSYGAARAPTPSPKKTPSLADKTYIFQLAEQPKQYDELQIKLQTLDFNVNEERNEQGDYIVHVIVRGGLCQLPHLLSLVRDNGADIDLYNEEGMNALMIASADGNAVLVDVILCVLGSNPNGPNPKNGFCAIHYAATYNRTDVADCLIKRGADFNLENAAGHRADDIARISGSDECEEFIVTERKQRVESLANTVMNGVLKLTELLVTDLYQLTEQGETLIMLAAKYNKTNNLRILIGREGCPVDAQHGSTGRTALGMACINGHPNIVQILMQHDANASLKDIDGLLPIHHTVINDQWEVAEVLLHFERALIGLHLAYKNSRSSRMRDLLRMAIQRRQAEIVTPALFEFSLTGDAQSLYCLLEEGDDVSPISGVGNWPMYLAAEYGHLEVMKLLHHFRGDMTKKHPSTRNTVLHIACERGHFLVVQFVLQFASTRPTSGQLDINGQNNCGKTPLHLASEKGSRKTVALLLERGASTAVLSADGNMISSPQYLGVQFLIESKRDEHAKEIAQALKEKKNIQRLHDVFENKFDHNIRDSKGDTPLMIACKYGNFLAVKYLLMSAARQEEMQNIFESDDDSGIGAPLGAQRKRCESIHDQGEDGEGPSWMVATTGHMDNVRGRRETLRAGVAAHSRLSLLVDDDRFENRIRPRVLSRSTLNLGSDEDIAKDIFALSLGESHISDINPLDGRAAIHRAVEHGDEVSIVQALIDADRSSVNIQDHEGLSPMHLACRLARKKIVQKIVSLPFIDLNLRTLDGKLPEEMTNNKHLIHLILLNRRGERRSSVNTSGANNIDFNDSASQAGRQSTILDLDELNKKFYRMRDKVLRKTST